jgi:hypothetical protein
VATLRLSGLEPDVIAGDQFRLLVGARDLRSTAFEIDKHGDRLEFTGRGYGHGVGMCVIGAGRRARRGESAGQILGQYYPGLAVTLLDTLPPRFRTDTTLTTNVPVPAPVPVPQPRAGPVIPAPVAPAAIVPPASKSSVVIRGAATASDLQPLALRAQEAMARVLGVTVTPITVDAHDTVEGFRQATGKPWWVSASVNGGIVDWRRWRCSRSVTVSKSRCAVRWHRRWWLASSAAARMGTRWRGALLSRAHATAAARSESEVEVPGRMPS